MPLQTPARAAAEPKRPAQPQIDDLRVTAHMMTLDTYPKDRNSIAIPAPPPAEQNGTVPLDSGNIVPDP